MPRPIIYYRDDGTWTPEEQKAAEEAGFFCWPTRMRFELNDLVIPRYSALPFYKELEDDLASVGADLINTYAQHRYIADLRNWYADLEGLTPKTWFNPADVPMGEPGSFVLKGATNSKKFLWRTHMFALSRGHIGRVLSNLLDDTLISTQQVYVRQYVPLKFLVMGLNDLAVCEEYRFFVLDGEILSGAFYWSSHTEEVQEVGWQPNPHDVPKEFLAEVLRRIKGKVPFVVIDVARTQEGNWIVIELNDGQMSGLSDNNPTVLYQGMRTVLDQRGGMTWR